MKPQTAVFSVTALDAWTTRDSSGQGAALLEPSQAPAAVQIGLEAASAPVGEVPAKGCCSTAAPMPIPTGGNPSEMQGMGGSRRDPGDPGEETMLPILSAGAAACQSVLSFHYISVSTGRHGTAVPPAAHGAGGT